MKTAFIEDFESVKPEADGYFVYADKKLLTLTTLTRAHADLFAGRLRNSYPLMKVEVLGVHTLARRSRMGGRR